MIPADHIPPAIHFELPKPPPLCLDRMADALKAVENSGRFAVSRSGAVGFYQIMPRVWRQYSTRLQWSASEQEQRRVALALLADIRAELIRNGFPPTPFLTALAYGAGVRATVTRKASWAKRDYAARAENIYRSKP